MPYVARYIQCHAGSLFVLGISVQGVHGSGSGGLVHVEHEVGAWLDVRLRPRRVVERGAGETEHVVVADNVAQA